MSIFAGPAEFGDKYQPPDGDVQVMEDRHFGLHFCAD
jgi:hypothetical protein